MHIPKGTTETVTSYMSTYVVEIVSVIHHSSLFYLKIFEELELETCVQLSQVSLV